MGNPPSKSMGNIKSIPHLGDHLIENRRRSRQSLSESLPPTPTVIKPTTSIPIQPPPVVVPFVKEHTKRVELSERDIAFLCSQTGFSSEDIVRWHKKFFQDNPSGRLDRTGFRKFYCLLRNEPPERLNDMCDHVFRAFDVDGNGYVEFGEFLLGFAICSRGDLRARLAYAFECYDIDSNGYLTEDEIEPVLRAMYSLLGIKHVQDYPPEAVAKDIMKKLDTSNSGKVSRDEFIHVLLKDGVYRNMMNPFH